jgi:hypothetical protein
VGTPLARDAAVAVLGAGAMGAGIAQVAAQAGHRVLLYDARIGAADEARAKLAATLDALAAKGKLAAHDAKAAAARIEPIHTPAACVSAKLVVEAIVEDLDAKRQLLHDLEVVVAPDAILASNTSSLSITALAAGMKHPGRIAGLHFFNPAPLMPLVEVVRGLATAPDVIETLHATAAAWGKTPVLAASTPGFIVNRCARPFYGEALRLIAENAATPAHDRRADARRRRLPHGPVRADGPDRARRQLRGDEERVGGDVPRPALCPVDDPARARRRPASSGASRIAASTTTRKAPRRRRRRSPRPRRRPRASRSTATRGC